MATSTITKERPPAYHHKSRKSQNDQGLNTAPADDEWMERILGKLRTTPQDDLLKRIATLPDIRRGKVLNMCRRLGKGGYPAEDRFYRTIDRVLEAVMT